jgi:hypothetical protein
MIAKNNPARRGAVLSVLPDMPFDPEPYIPAAHCWNGGPVAGAGGKLFPTAAEGNALASKDFQDFCTDS